MYTDMFGQQVYSENDLRGLFLKTRRTIAELGREKHSIFTFPLNNRPELLCYEYKDISVEAFDESNQNTWHLTEEYKNFDIAKFVLNQCTQMMNFNVLEWNCYCSVTRHVHATKIFKISSRRNARKIILFWDMALGSSVASFVLFLIGVLRINSLYCDCP